MSFLGPQDRTLLLESLRPPEDFHLDIAIGTTYSLDLIAMMVAPVGFTFFDVDPNDPDFLGRDPLEVLEAIRRHASQIVLFYEAGRIAVPRHYRPLLTYLEERIVPVRAPTPKRSFHPKVWFIRYSNPAKEVWYRLICLSRNLTFDRSWDTVLILDGYLREDRRVGFGLNADLREFIAALPGMAVAPLAPGVKGQVATIEKEIARVEWDLGDLPFDLTRFWPLGFDGVKRWPFKGRMERVAVVSPFLSDKTLFKLSAGKGDHVLISRQECLDRLAETTRAEFDECYQMSDSVPGAEPEDLEATPSLNPPLRGLHAKLYVADDGWDARIWTGSANATISAFEGNVEFLVELVGQKSAVGVDAFLDKIKGSTSFMDLLEPYTPPDSPVGNAEQEALELEIDQLRMPIAAAGWSISVTVGEDPQLWLPTATTSAKLPPWPDHISVTCRPASMGDPSARPLKSGSSVSEAFTPLALESLTSFLVIEIDGRTAAAQHRIQFLVNAQLVGAPANRKDRLLRHMLQDKRSVLRFLLLLLADASDPLPAGENGKGGKWGRSLSSEAESQALLEPLLRALDRSPARLTAISTLLAELGGTDEGKALIPEGLADLFAAIWTARETAAQ
jgi:hypothetical protein